MRNLLLGAKYFAQQADSEQITTDHLESSLECLQPVDRKGYDLILEVLKVNEKEPKSSEW